MVGSQGGGGETVDLRPEKTPGTCSRNVRLSLLLTTLCVRRQVSEVNAGGKGTWEQWRGRRGSIGERVPRAPLLASSSTADPADVL